MQKLNKRKLKMEQSLESYSCVCNYNLNCNVSCSCVGGAYAMATETSGNTVVTNDRAFVSHMAYDATCGLNR